MTDAQLAEAGAADDWAAAMAEQAAVEAGQAAGGAKDNVQPAPLEDLKPGVVRADTPANLEAILDIPVTLSVQIGATKISIRNLLQLNQGSVVELDRLAGEPLDVLVNGTLVAHGEVVVVNEKFGIRLTDVVSAQERVRKLQ
ncbi:MAG: Flagellar motor switch protein FliN [Gammaproteobacteria bacterium]|nr:Flagellar motor switch protein FliN [Gammaproteobacteria bacterium]